MVSTTFILYGMSVSTCTQKVLMALHEKNIPFEFVNINVLKREQKLPKHVARHPFGKIPVLEDGQGNLLFESVAIVRYLDALYPRVGHQLVPSDPYEAALVDQWTAQSAFNFYPHAQGVIVETAIKPVAKIPTDGAHLLASRAALEPTLDIYNQHFVDHKYFANDSMSLADLAHLPYLNVLNRTQPDLIKSRPNLAAWFDRMTAEPSWEKTMEWVAGAPKCH
ncbi:hypothetical protein HKX48_008167 [Thoreauomyces humboldtii]|nr:hypothetical protein HKX48_008167 [Thoreauomyces humboldtii]